ncbi:type II toxin-antitoxin system HipA family toxin [Methylobacterium sp. 092160098-2]|uniref:type II toxin-antitoxin system HipA family toxin n=1 Tax=Methylobacterium sp. 092160098-2 TaxID=3025129 RepID=UPI002381C3AA|nr:type II toxin-antitoxin system HipA family toxin [Methylobacterium sp. 092160098-2]MDE4915109.1 type II toxin-antitoxin system HipA family toxin [Methylobacterium sp. 092160098-2]
MSTPSLLHVLMGGVPLGRITRDGNRLVLTYDPAWLERGARAVTLSMSMPLTAAVHRGDAITNFLWNLLPDSEQTLAGWAAKFQVSARNPFALLAHTGEDCPGAIQLVREERLDAVTGPGEIVWIDDAEVARRLAELRRDAGTSGRARGETGQFSLAGAQPKTALIRLDGRWGVPSGRVPTTHILKPPVMGFAGHAENEHVCLQVAATVGMRAARTEVMRFGKEVAIVVERYDRVVQGTRVLRSHQEDMCQALGVPPWSKYENDGGPGIRAIVNDVLRWSEDSLATRRAFLKAVVFNQIIGGSDAHAKNYSILHAASGKMRLAPLYDIASIWPYETDTRKLKMAMRIGGKYKFDEILPRHWEAETRGCGMQPEDALGPMRDLLARLPDAFADVSKRAVEGGLSKDLTLPLADAVAERCRFLTTRYGREDVPGSPVDSEDEEETSTFTP